VTKWLIEANRDCGRRLPWISIPGVASIVYWGKRVFGATNFAVCLVVFT